MLSYFFEQIQKLERSLEEVKRFLAIEKVNHNKAKLAIKAAGDLMRNMKLKQRNLKENLRDETNMKKKFKLQCEAQQEENKKLHISLQDMKRKEEKSKKELKETKRMFQRSEEDLTLLKGKINDDTAKNMSEKEALQRLLQTQEHKVRKYIRLKKEMHQMADKSAGMEKHLADVMEKSVQELNTNHQQLKLKRKEVKELKMIVKELSDALEEKTSILTSKEEDMEIILSNATNDTIRMKSEKDKEISVIKAAHDMEVMNLKNEVKALKMERDTWKMEKDGAVEQSKASMAELKKESKF